jgi:L-malate glycosyltransferase
MSARADRPPHLLHVFSTFGVGGPQTRFVSLVNALGRKYRHTVLAMDARHDAAAGLSGDVDCVFATMPVVKTAGISIANLRHARHLLRAVRPDLLLTYNWGTIEWSLANFVAPHWPQIHIEDGFGPDESPTQQNPRRILTRRLLLARADAIVVPSYTLLDVATRMWRLKRVNHVPNGIDCERFARPTDDALLAALGIDGPGPVVGTVAGLRPEKNLRRLLHIFAALPAERGARLVIVGDGPERALLAETAAQLGIAQRVVLTGALANPERVLARFTVFALTSDTEQMPNSVLEAMAAGLPVLASDVGDLKRILAPDNAAFVLPRDDLGRLTQALDRLICDQAVAAAIGRANRAHVLSHYSLAAMVARYEALFAQAGSFDAH